MIPYPVSSSGALDRYSTEVDLTQLFERRAEALHKHGGRSFEMYCRLLQEDPFARLHEIEIPFSLDVPAIRIGELDQLQGEECASLTRAIESLIPWRKGPFVLFGQQINSEWRSDWKWQRLLPGLPPLKGLRVADIGCGNGYYMLRAASLRPELIVGFEPFERYFHQYHLITQFLPNLSIQFEPLHARALACFPAFFDVVLCLGVIYHQRNPWELLDLIRQSLRPGGTVILESQTIPGELPYALVPEKRYAKARNVYYVPTLAALSSWLLRSAFTEVQTVSTVTLSVEEQRRTAHAPGESFADFLDPEDARKTVEGYPAPLRTCVRAIKNGR